MNDILYPGAGILFMKVGTHAQESLADIIARKTKEIEDTGYAMWGYGGNTCHPTSMVQPFAAAWETKNSPIFLCMQEMNSRHAAEPLRANEYSEDGLFWDVIPKSINVFGSRFALVIESLQPAEITLQLANAQVAVGISKGRAATRYIKGQVDKACLEILDSPLPDLKSDEIRNVQINLVAKLKSPYAVFLRDHRRKIVASDEGVKSVTADGIDVT